MNLLAKISSHKITLYPQALTRNPSPLNISQHKCFISSSMRRSSKAAKSLKKLSLLHSCALNVVIRPVSGLNFKMFYLVLLAMILNKRRYMKSVLQHQLKKIEGQQWWKQPLNEWGDGRWGRHWCLCEDFLTSPNSRSYLMLACSRRLEEVWEESGAGKLTKAHHFLYIVHSPSRI